MVAVPATRISQFLRKPDPKITGFLIYGSDAGQISERAAELARTLVNVQKPSGEIITLTEQDLINDPDRLAVETRTSSMFATNKVVRLKATGRAAQIATQSLSEDTPRDAIVILETGNLKKDAKLRQLFERSKHLAALPCYGDAEKDIRTLIKDELSSANIRIRPDAERHLLDLLGADHALSRMEIQKLATYVHGASEISIEDVDAIVGDSSVMAMDVAIDAALAGNTSHALAEFDRLIASGMPPGTCLILLLTHLKRLHFIQSRVSSGDTLDAALRRLRPPVHFRREHKFKSQCRDWDVVRLNWAVSKVTNAIRDARSVPDMDHQIAVNTLVGLCRAHGRCVS